MATILVTGANGQLGQEIKRLSASEDAFVFVFVSRNELDISNEAAVMQKFEALKPDFCINCAAYTAVDKAETEQEGSFAINAAGTGYLAKASKAVNCRLVHVSTDYVFNGMGNRPYREEDPVDPVNAYGASKLEGERLALAYNPDVIIIRTAWVYSEFGNNFVKTMLRLMTSRSEISVVSDQLGTPTYAADLAAAIVGIIKNDHWKPGIYHYSNEGEISWYEFALEIKNQTNSTCIVHPIPTESYPTPAKRPSYSVLDKTKIQEVFKLTLRNWKESLHECLVRLGQ